MTTRGRVFLKHKDPARSYRVWKRSGEGLQIDRGPDKRLGGVRQLLLEIVNKAMNFGTADELSDRFIKLRQVVHVEHSNPKPRIIRI